MKKLWGCLLTLTFIGILVGCTGRETEPSASSSTSSPVAENHGGHHHTAPHGGALVVLGEEFAHLEFVLEPDSGILTAYVLDGEAEKAIRLSSGFLELELKPDGKLPLEAVADELTGETKNDTSTFQAVSDLLKGKESFEAAIVSVEVKGQVFKDLPFRYPDGNEAHEHEHEHDDHPGHDSH